MEQFDPILLSNTKEWLLWAKEDLDAAALVLNAPSPLVRTALFHCQQAVEKTMKAFLTWHDACFREVHNLEELGEFCIRLDSTLASAVTSGTPLTKYAVRFRYPGAPYEPSAEEAQESMGLAHQFVDSVLAKLPQGLMEGSR
jgi:HEPN domain-containing protein